MAARLSLTYRAHVRRFMLSRPFALLWGGQTISALGTQLSSNALILLAILTLSATPAQASLLTMLGALPALCISPLAGALADRFPPRWVMILADTGRMVLLMMIPLAALAGALNFTLLATVYGLAGLLAVVFEVAYPTLTPTIVAPEHLLAANGKLAASEAVAEVGGPALAGAFTQALGAPFVVLLDTLSFGVSVLTLGLIHVPACSRDKTLTDERKHGAPLPFWHGWRVACRAPVVRVLLLVAALAGITGGFFAPLYAIYTLRDLHIAPGTYGVLIGLGGISALAGSATVAWIARRLGQRRALLVAWGLIVVGQALVPLAGGPVWAVSLWLGIAQLTDIAWVIYDVTATTQRQANTPAAYLGRSAAIFRFTGALALLGGAALTAWLALFLPARALLLLGVGVSVIAWLILYLWLPALPEKPAVA